AFSVYNGRATWDAAGKANAPTGSTNGAAPVTNTNTTVVSTNTAPGTDTNSTPIAGTNSSSITNITADPGTNSGVVSTNTSGSSTNASSPSAGSNSLGANVVDYINLEMPRPGANTLHILSPTLLELELINTKQPDPATVDQWNLV